MKDKSIYVRGDTLMQMPHLGIRTRVALGSLVFTAISLWGCAGTLRDHVDDQTMVMIVGAAVAFTIATASTFLSMILRDRDKELLLNCLVEASQRAAVARTIPLRVLRVTPPAGIRAQRLRRARAHARDDG
jgi:hypothetical protein